MSLQFYLGASGSGKSYQLHKDIIEWAGKEPDTNFLYIVPNQFTMQTQIDMVNATPNGGIMNIDILSFERLAHRVFEELGGENRSVLDDTGKSLVLRHLADKIATDMPVIGKNLNKIGYIHEIKSVISEFKQYDISPDKLETLIAYSNSRGMLNAKLKDIKTIYKAFDDYICNDYVTSEETMTLLRDKVGDSKIVAGSVIVLDGFTGFTPVQYALIQRLLELTNRVIVSITIDIDANPYSIEGEQELFYLSKKTIKDIQLLAQEVNVSFEKDVILKNNFRYQDNALLMHLEKNIFRYPITKYDSNAEQIEIIESVNPNKEVDDCFLKIKELVMLNKWEYRDISIICADLKNYHDEFIRAAKVYDVPIYLDENKKITLNPFVEYIRSALLIIRDNFSYDAIMHFLRTGLSGLMIEDVDFLDDYLLKRSIRGKKKWKDDFTLPPYSAISNGNSEYVEDIANENIAALRKLNNCRKHIMHLLEPLINSGNKTSDRVRALYDFIVLGDIEKKLLDYSDKFQAEGMEELSMEYRQIYSLVIDLLDQIFGLLGDEIISLDEFIHILESGFEEIDIGTIPGGVDKVIIGDLERSRVPEKRMLMLLGINDGNVPKNNNAGGIISDIDREFLKESEVQLAPSPREQVFIQRLYLYMNMTKPKERLYVSFSRLGLDGKSKRESYLIGTLRKMFPAIEVVSSDKKTGIFEKIYGYKDAKSLLSKALHEYSYGQLESLTFEQLVALFKVLENQYDRETLIKLEDAAFSHYITQKLSKGLAEKLYGVVLSNSISRLEKFQTCQYAHFLKYGIKLNSREEGEFQATDLGNVYHNVLKAFSNRMRNDGYTLLNFPDEMLEQDLRKVVEEETTIYASSLLHSSAKNSYMIEKIYDMSEVSLETIKEQLQQGAFIPEYFEHQFKETIDISDEKKINIRGQIDRVDICRDGDNTYVKVVDYKSSEKTIDMDTLYYGLSFQQPVYMMHMLRELSQKESGRTATMAAMLYYHIDNPLIEASANVADDLVINSVKKELKQTGLVSDRKDIVKLLDRNLADDSATSYSIPVSIKKDGEFAANSKLLSDKNYSLIEEYVQNKIADIGKDILDGKIDINPIVHGEKDSCKYCDYKDICKYDTKIEGYSKKKLPKMSQDEALEAMQEYINNSNEKGGSLS